MHEMALAEGILAVALDVAEGWRVQRVRVQVGELQRVVPDVLHFSFELAAQDTLAQGAFLELVDVPARVRCRRCGAETAPPAFALACGECGALEVDLVAGDALLVGAVQLESGWVYAPTEDEHTPPPVTVPAEHLAWHALHDAQPTHEHAAAIQNPKSQIQNPH